MTFFECALSVQFEEPGKNFVTNFIGPTVAIFLPFGPAVLVLVFFVAELGEELAHGSDVVPAVGVEDSTVHRVVQPTQTLDIVRVLVRIVEAIVSLCAVQMPARAG